MTPDEMGAALGPGWRDTPYKGAGKWVWGRHRLDMRGWVVPQSDGRYMVEWNGPRWPYLTPEQAVAVAHLLVAAERIADGAEVAEDRRPTYEAGRHDPIHGRMVLAANGLTTPACARRDALDLLRAADEAER